MKQLPVTIFLVMEDGKLVPKRDMDKFKLQNYLKTLEEGQTVQVTYEEHAADGTYAQISKIQACTRELANYLGYTHEEVKDMIKVRAGLYDSEANLKSFADCSKEELSLVIQTVLDFGEQVDFPLQ
jgi:predicted peroxiredoxin